MKTNFFLLIWFVFLTKEEQQEYKRHLNNIPRVKDNLIKKFLKEDFSNEDTIKNFLYLSLIGSFSNINHRRKNIFSFNPKTRDDLLYLYYKENLRDITELTFLQRIFLSRLVFKVKTKTVTYFDVELSSIKNPIIIEVDNVS